MVRVRAQRRLENSLRRHGFCRIAGVDEVGRGCLAGPVVAAAVILDPKKHIPGLRDSKLTTISERERLYKAIISSAVAWSVAAVTPEEIDRINIQQASLEAMRYSVIGLVPLPDIVLVDAFRIPGILMAQQGIVHGDQKCSVIAAASIIAKVTRDREMLRHHIVDPRYGYDRHKGYATAQHLKALSRFGYSSLHRKSFRPRSLLDLLNKD